MIKEKTKPERVGKRTGILKRYFPKRYKRVRVILIVVGALIAIRIALPYLVLHLVNKRLANMPGYYGHVEDVDLAIWRGAYKLKGAYLDKVDSTGKRTPFFETRYVDLSVEWHSLFRGRVVGKMYFQDPVMRFVKEAITPEQLSDDEDQFRDLRKDLMPLEINRLEVDNGQIHYVDPGSHPPVDVYLENTHILASNLINVQDTSLLPAHAMATANVYGGEARCEMKLDLLAQYATFDMNLEMKSIDLTRLNEFFQAYAKVDVNKGTFGLYAEIASKQGTYTGYVKPIIQDLDVLGHEDREDNVLRKIWEGLVGLAGEVLSNQPKDQVATKIPIEGDLDESHVGILTALVQVLRNAFIQALQPSLDYEISIQSVEQQPDKKGLKDLFERKEPKKKKEKPGP